MRWFFFPPLITTFLPLATRGADTHPGQVIRSFPCPSPCPTGIAAAGDRLWIVDRFTDTIIAGPRFTCLRSDGTVRTADWFGDFFQRRRFQDKGTARMARPEHG